MNRDPEKIRAWQQRSNKRRLEKLRAEAKTLKPNTLRRKPLKKQSKGRARQMQEYYAIRKEWLSEPRNAVCMICILIGEHPRASTEVHHARGRGGRLLCDTRFFVASCYPHRLVPHERPVWAREMEILATATEWGVYPPPGK